jgi:two-component system, LytTR family, response regulator
MHRALLIDDESAVRGDLRAKLTAHPEVVVVGEAATVGEARTLLAGAAYDLVFLDIQLIGGSGFELVPHVQPGARVVFVTAYDRFALRAIEVNALDYLLKPVRPYRLAESLRRLPRTGEPAGEAPVEVASGPPLRLDDIVHLRDGLRARFAPVAAIALISSADNYSEVRLADGSVVLVRRSLKAWEDALPATHFMRVHRTQLVNLAHVTRYQRDGDEHTLLFLAGTPAPVPASRAHWRDLRERIRILRPEP